MFTFSMATATRSCPSARAFEHAVPLRGWRHSLLAALAMSCGATLASAQALDAPGQPEPRRMFIEAGRATNDVGIAAVGVQWPWQWRREFLGGELTGHWEAHVAHWRVSAGAAAPGRRQWTQLSVVPALRLRFDGGRSPWFVEGGIGLSVLDGYFRTRQETFSTRFNFTDHLGLGLNFGERRQHELMLALRHVSNGGIKKPNPGQNFVQLRYSMAF
jgi:hypothetical protein